MDEAMVAALRQAYRLGYQAGWQEAAGDDSETPPSEALLEQWAIESAEQLYPYPEKVK